MTAPHLEVIDVEAPVGWQFSFGDVLSTSDMSLHRCLLIDMLFDGGRRETVTLPAHAAFDVVRTLKDELEGN